MFIDPLEDWLEAELSFFDRLRHKVACRQWLYFEIKAVDDYKGVGRGKRYALVTVKEWMIVRQRFHQRCGLLSDAIVVANLRTEDGGLQECFIPESVNSAVGFDELVMNLKNFGYGQVDRFRHLLGQLPI